MAKVSFSGYDKTITINNGITSVDVGVDIYSEWKRWCSNHVNMKWNQALSVIGGDQLTDTKKLGTTFFLNNGWKIRPFEGNHTLYVNGNLYASDGSSPFIKTLSQYNVSIISMVSNLVDTEVVTVDDGTGSGGTTQPSYPNMTDVVYIDINSNTTGITYPSGTKENPVNNINDAISIAYNNNIENIKLLSDITIDINLTNINIHGNNHSIAFNNANIQNCTITRSHVSGIINGDAILSSCIVSELFALNLECNNCDIRSMTIGGSALKLISCYSTGLNNVFTLSMYSNDISDVTIISFTGSMILKNSIQNHKYHINISSGSLILDSTCSNGDIKLSGVTNLINYSSISSVDTVNTISANVFASNVINYRMDDITDTSGNSLGSYLKYKLLTIFRYIGLK